MVETAGLICLTSCAVIGVMVIIGMIHKNFAYHPTYDTVLRVVMVIYVISFMLFFIPCVAGIVKGVINNGI